MTSDTDFLLELGSVVELLHEAGIDADSIARFALGHVFPQVGVG